VAEEELEGEESKKRLKGSRYEHLVLEKSSVQSKCASETTCRKAIALLSFGGRGALKSIKRESGSGLDSGGGKDQLI